jgi:hypothetical protein
MPVRRHQSPKLERPAHFDASSTILNLRSDLEDSANPALDLSGQVGSQPGDEIELDAMSASRTDQLLDSNPLSLPAGKIRAKYVISIREG